MRKGLLLAVLAVRGWACSCAPALVQYCEKLPDPGNPQEAVFLGTVKNFYPQSRQQMDQLRIDFNRTHPELLAQSANANGLGRRIRGAAPDDQEFRREFIRSVWGNLLSAVEQEQLRNADQREIDRLMFDYRRRAVFQVTENFAGADGSEFELYTNLDGPSCGFDFVEGRTYLVEAYRAGPGERWKVTSCRPPRLLSDAEGDLSVLRAWKNGQRLPGRVLGQIMTRDPRQNAAGVRVQLLGGRPPLETSVDAGGQFEFRNLDAGIYQIQVGFPVLRSLAVDLTRAACARVEAPLEVR